MRESQSHLDFPQLYVRGQRGDSCIEVDLASGSFVERPDGSYCRIIYEMGRDIVLDLERGVARESFVVLFPLSGTAILVEKGAQLRLLEVSGKETYLVKREGEEVMNRDVISYIVTGKGETRSVRAGTDGTIVYIAWAPGKPEKYIVAISSEHRVLRRG